MDRCGFNPVFDSVPSARSCSARCGSTIPGVSIPSSIRCRLQVQAVQEEEDEGPQEFQSRLRFGAVCKLFNHYALFFLRSFNPVFDSVPSASIGLEFLVKVGWIKFQSRLRFGAVCKVAFTRRASLLSLPSVSIPSSIRCRLQGHINPFPGELRGITFQSRLRFGAVCKRVVDVGLARLIL